MMTHPTMLSRAEAYLAYRRHLGFKLDRPGDQTLSFARFADDIGHQGALTSEIAVRWAKDAASRGDPFTWARRLDILRPFALHLTAEEPDTTFPATSPFGSSKRRLAPHIFAPEEITAILSVARKNRRACAAGTLMLPPLIGLLASTGLRISEALGLQIGDLDLKAAHIVVRQAKYGRQRIVALHPTTVAALSAFVEEQCRGFRCSRNDPLFKNELTGGVLRYANVRHAWSRLVLKIGIRPRGEHPSVRLHDLRHTFICRRIMDWQANGADVDAAMMMLSTYVGHVNLRDTYWYLESVPELMALAGRRFEQRFHGAEGDCDE
ncbi:tyrosine-type recombinase/integrase [Bosea sp. MMO-172]|uniref:tyrosine-type recombinase/integrase n=1 Tax=Bosea sp. MMO-172 TaxID=3127885 RepID=UPI0030187598